MFGHGQIEGYAEKYGMEYRKAYRNERPNRDMISRHERQIFPLLQKRMLFSGMSHFLLYDFFTANGMVDENVIVFSNQYRNERCLVIYHNCFGHAVGTINMSTAFVQASGSGSLRPLVQINIARGLELPEGQNQFVIFRDLVSQLKYIRNCRQLYTQGLAIELGSYQTHVFIDFKEMADDANGRLARLDAYLHGGGTDSLEKVGREMSLQPLHNALRELCQADILARQLEIFHGRSGSKNEGVLWQELEEKVFNLFSLAPENTGDAAVSHKAAEALLENLLALRALLRIEKRRLAKGAGNVASTKQYLQEYFQEKPEMERLFLLVFYMRGLIELGSEKRPDGRALFDEWLLDGILAEILCGWSFSENNGEPARLMIRIACGFGTMIDSFSTALVQAGAGVGAATEKLIKTMTNDDDVRTLLQLHRHENELFFNREAFNGFCAWLTTLIMWELNQTGKKARASGSQSAGEVLNIMNFLPVLAAKAEYKLEVFLKELEHLEVG
jgi:hypothetical protein